MTPCEAHRIFAPKPAHADTEDGAGLAEERRQFNARIRELETQLAALQQEHARLLALVGKLPIAGHIERDGHPRLVVFIADVRAALTPPEGQ